MLVLIGVLTSIYVSYLVLPSRWGSINTTKLSLTRITSLVLLVQILWNLDTLVHGPWTLGGPAGSGTMLSPTSGFALLLMDGNVKLDFHGLVSIVVILSFALGILLLYGSALSSRPEVYFILMTNLVGLIYLIDTTDWLVTVIAWELFNLSLYLLVGMNANESEAVIASTIKYFLLSALTTGFLLLSVGWLYGLTGTTNHGSLVMIMSTMGADVRGGLGAIQYGPLVLMLVAILFKLGAAPLHNWAPDLYDSIPTTITLWMVIIPKLGVLLFLIQLYQMLSIIGVMDWILIHVALLSILVGACGLGSQWKFKRFMAYSSISNLGFILLAVTAGSHQYTSLLFYTLVYCVANLVVFAILIGASTHPSAATLTMGDMAGLYKLNPAAGLALSLALFSLAGIPPLAGFYSKLLVILFSLLNQGYAYLACLVVLITLVSAANYLRVIRITHLDAPRGRNERSLTLPYGAATLVTLCVGVVLVLLFNVTYLFHLAV